MNKKILLVEPAYKTRYPPFGLMKIAAYHKMLGDEVVFVKGPKAEVRFQYWDRVYINTLFTWTWAETVKTVNFYHDTLFNFAGKCFVGGILATLMPQELFNETGIPPVIGLLDDPSKIEQSDDIIIDTLAPDYDILPQVENEHFKYSYTDAYLGYATRGCIRKCDYCAVRTLEPHYVPYVDIKRMVKDIKASSGEKQNLILMDNNVLASNRFDQIIDDIKSVGFVNGATFGPTRRKMRVDFNQGLDARLLTEEKMKRLAEIPIEPMRIAFDSIEYKDVYIKAVRLAHKYGQRDMSNYILYNFRDTPEDFYERLLINIQLNEDFRKEGGVRTNIFSFPMRFIPLNATTRNVSTGNLHWNPRYLRGIQSITNVMKGSVMPGIEFFIQAFGRDFQEFRSIISMPDTFIRHRLVDNWKNIQDYDRRLMPYVKDWMNIYKDLTQQEMDQLLSILGENNKDAIAKLGKAVTNKKLVTLLKYHLEEEDIVKKYKPTAQFKK
ncbi:radical SAM protein [Chloroflexota bacterium]